MELVCIYCSKKKKNFKMGIITICKLKIFMTISIGRSKVMIPFHWIRYFYAELIPM